MIGIIQLLCSMFRLVHTISKENIVVTHSLNYSNDIDEGTCGIFSCIRVRCTQSLECEVCTPPHTFLPGNCD